MTNLMYHLKHSRHDESTIHQIRARLAMTAPVQYFYRGPDIRVSGHLLRTGTPVLVSALQNTVVINAQAIELNNQDYSTLTSRLRRKL